MSLDQVLSSFFDIPILFREHDGDERAARRCWGTDEAGGRRGRAGAEYGTSRCREQHDRHDGGQQRPGRVEPEAGQTQAVDFVGREFVIGWERVEFGKFGQSDYLIYKAYVRVACKKSFNITVYLLLCNLSFSLQILDKRLRFNFLKSRERLGVKIKQVDLTK